MTTEELIDALTGAWRVAWDEGQAYYPGETWSTKPRESDGWFHTEEGDPAYAEIVRRLRDYDQLLTFAAIHGAR